MAFEYFICTKHSFHKIPILDIAFKDLLKNVFTLFDLFKLLAYFQLTDHLKKYL